jgi:predicted outer membrane repeat protein
MRKTVVSHWLGKYGMSLVVLLAACEAAPGLSTDVPANDVAQGNVDGQTSGSDATVAETDTAVATDAQTSTDANTLPPDGAAETDTASASDTTDPAADSGAGSTDAASTTDSDAASGVDTEGDVEAPGSDASPGSDAVTLPDTGTADSGQTGPDAQVVDDTASGTSDAASGIDTASGASDSAVTGDSAGPWDTGSADGGTTAPDTTAGSDTTVGSDTTTGADTVVVLVCSKDEDCSDGTACTKDYCIGTECLYEPVKCDDGNPCTVDSCDPAVGCATSPRLPVDAAVAQSECQSECADPIAACKADPECVAVNDCVYKDNCYQDQACLNACAAAHPNGVYPFNVYLGCYSPCIQETQYGLCDDGKGCTVNDVCDGKGGCTGSLQTGPCDDGDECSGGDVCQTDGSCKGPESLCTGACKPSQFNFVNYILSDYKYGAGCANAKDLASIKSCAEQTYYAKNQLKDEPACLDCATQRIACTQSSGPCAAACAIPGATCTVCLNQKCVTPYLECTGQTGCVSSACDDNNNCTQNDCAADDQSCTWTPQSYYSCSDGNDCTDDNCTAQGACKSVKRPDQSYCSDGSACTQGDICSNGVCVATPLEDGSNFSGLGNSACSDYNECTFDYCQAGKCKSSETYPYKGNWEQSYEADQCKYAGCVCGDTAESCSASLWDYHPEWDCCPDPWASGYPSSIPEGFICDNEGSCTNVYRCTSGTCTQQTNGCDDANACTADACGEKGCEHVAVNNTACEDGKACTTDEQCTGGACTALASTCACAADADCSDGINCTIDTCANQVCAHALIGCDDENPCTDDSCWSQSNGPSCRHTANAAVLDLPACEPDECSIGTPVCTDGEVVCSKTGGDPNKDGKPCQFGEGSCQSGECVLALPPTIVSAKFAGMPIKPGSAATVTVIVTDPGATADSSGIASVVLDASSIGGAADVPMLAVGPDTLPQSTRYEAAVTTDGLEQGAWLLPVTVTDNDGFVRRGVAVLYTYTGALLRVGVGQTYTAIKPAIAAAVDGDAVVINPGLYKGNSNKQIGLSGKKILVMGDEAGEVKIDCEGALSAFALIAPNAKETNKSVIARLTITNALSGAIAVNPGTGATSTPTLAELYLVGNKHSTDSGAGVRLAGTGAGATIVNSVFENNTATGDGGGIYSEGSITVNNCLFKGNQGGTGSGLYVTSSSSAKVEDSGFEANVANGYGSGTSVYLSAQGAQMTRCSIQNGSSYDTTAVLYAGTNVTLDQVNLSGNAKGGARLAGGATWSSGKIEGCGGTLLALEANASATGLLIKNNITSDSAVTVADAASLTKSVLRNNAVNTLLDTYGTVSDLTIATNTASSDLILARKSLTRLTIVDNSSKQDLVVVTDKGTTLSDCVIEGNSATESTLYAKGDYCPWYDTQNCTLNFFNVLIRSNVSGNGTVWAQDAEFTHKFDYCTVIDNTSSNGAGFKLVSGTIDLKRTVVWGNKSTATSKPIANQLYVSPTSGSLTVQIQSCLFANGDNDVEDDAAQVNQGNLLDDGDPFGNKTQDPQLQIGQYGNGYLGQVASGGTKDSPAVDPADTLAETMSETHPLFGKTTRTDGVPDSGTVDWGFHFPTASSSP